MPGLRAWYYCIKLTARTIAKSKVRAVSNSTFNPCYCHFTGTFFNWINVPRLPAFELLSLLM